MGQATDAVGEGAVLDVGGFGFLDRRAEQPLRLGVLRLLQSLLPALVVRLPQRLLGTRPADALDRHTQPHQQHVENSTASHGWFLFES